MDDDALADRIAGGRVVADQVVVERIERRAPNTGPLNSPIDCGTTTQRPARRAIGRRPVGRGSRPAGCQARSRGRIRRLAHLDFFRLAGFSRHLGIGLLDDLDRVVGGGHAGIDRDMHHRLAQVLLGRAGVARRAHVHRQLLVVAERRQQRDGHHRALALGPVRPRPDGAPGALGDQGLERRVELGLAWPRRRRHGASPSTARRVSMPCANRPCFDWLGTGQSLLTKVIDPRGDQLRLLDARQMAGVGDGLEAARRDELAQRSDQSPAAWRRPPRPPGTRSAGVSCEVALGQVGVAQGRAGADIALDRRADQHVAIAGEVGRARSRGTRPRTSARARHRRSRRCRLRAPPRCARSTSPPFRSCGRCRTAPAARTRSGRLGGQGLGDHAADRQPDDDRVRDPVRIEQRGEIADMIVDGVGRRRRIGQPVAAQVVAQDAKVVGEWATTLVPDPQVGAERIHEHERARPPGFSSLK